MQPSRTSSPFVLIVEDEALVRDCAVAQLEDAGIRVIEAANAQEGLREFEDHARLTAVFTDINMPGPFDGLALAHKIFRQRPGVQLILTSGRGGPLASEMPAGAHFLMKPYDSSQLSALIKSA